VRPINKQFVWVDRGKRRRRPIVEVERALELGFAKPGKTPRYRRVIIIDHRGDALKKVETPEAIRLVDSGTMRDIILSNGVVVVGPLEGVRPTKITQQSDTYSHESRTNVKNHWAIRHKPGLDPRYFS